MRDLQGAFNLINSAQDFTGDWVDLGSPIPANTISDIGLWLQIDVNDSTDLQLRALGKINASDTTEYHLPIVLVSAGEESISTNEKVFDITGDTNIIVGVDTGNLVPFVQFQIKAGAVGATAGQIDSAKYTTCQIGA